MYDQNCFNKLNFESPISRQDFSYYLLVNKVVNGNFYFEKEMKNKFKIIIYDLDGFNQDGLNRKGFDRNGFTINETDENSFNRNKELVCEEKIKQAIRENPWNIYCVSEMFRNKYEIMKECVKRDPNTYQYPTLYLKQNVNLVIFFLERGGSFSSTKKHLRNNKKVGMITFENIPNSFQYVGKGLKDDDDIFKIAFQQNENVLRYASERLGKINIQS